MRWALKLGRISFKRQTLHSKIPRLSLSLYGSGHWHFLWEAPQMEQDWKAPASIQV